MLKSLEELVQIIRERKKASPDKSYTHKLLNLFHKLEWESQMIFLGWHYILHLMHPILLQDRYLLLMAALQPKC